MIREVLLILAIALSASYAHCTEVTLGHIETYSGVYYNDASYVSGGLGLVVHNEDKGNVYQVNYNYDYDNYFAFYRMKDDRINKRFSNEIGVGYGRYLYDTDKFKVKPSIANMIINNELNLSGRLKIIAIIDDLEAKNVTNLILPLGETRNKLSMSLKLTSGVFFTYSKDYMSNKEYETGSGNLGLKVIF